MLPFDDPDLVANMICLLFCAVNLLNHLDLHEYGQSILKAMSKALQVSDFTEKDLRGQFKIREFTDYIIVKLKPVN